MRILASALGGGLLLASCGGLGAATKQGPTTPENLNERVAAARDGETIVLPPGVYGEVIIKDTAHGRPIVLKAEGATMTKLTIAHVDGIVVKGGVITGAGGKSYGVYIDQSSNVTLEGMKITGAHRGVVVNVSSDVILNRLTLTELLSDGIDLAQSRRITVSNSTCRHFKPTLATYDAVGKRIRDGDHPDCIQAWSRPSEPPSADITVIGNDIEIGGQGIFFGNHVRDGVDDGGFDRIRIEHNVVRAGFPRGITLANARDSVVRFNEVSTIPGSVLPSNGNRVRATMEVIGLRTIVCGNKIADLPAHPAAQPCRQN